VVMFGVCGAPVPLAPVCGQKVVPEARACGWRPVLQPLQRHDLGAARMEIERIDRDALFREHANLMAKASRAVRGSEDTMGKAKSQEEPWGRRALRRPSREPPRREGRRACAGDSRRPRDLNYKIAFGFNATGDGTSTQGNCSVASWTQPANTVAHLYYRVIVTTPAGACDGHTKAGGLQMIFALKEDGGGYELVQQDDLSRHHDRSRCRRVRGPIRPAAGRLRILDRELCRPTLVADCSVGSSRL
jgi:hypothetical protein